MEKFKAVKKTPKLKRISPADASALSILVQAKPESRPELLKFFRPKLGSQALSQARRMVGHSARRQGQTQSHLPLHLVPR